MQRAILSGSGRAFPQKVITNADLARTIETTDEWIRERTGIRQRHCARDDESLASLAAEAAQRALEMAGVAAADVDGIILATTTPDHPMPATALRVQALLGARRAFAFDVQAVCSGFLYALSIADHFIRGGSARTILVLGADCMSRVVDWTDRSTCILFGDGAGALVLQAEESDASRGVLSTHLYADGGSYSMLYVDPSVPTDGGRGALKMNGRAVFSAAIESMGSAIQTALSANGLGVDQVDWFIAHQANKRIIESVAGRVGLAESKTLLTIDQYANTSAATIPTTLDVAVRDGRVQPGDLLLFAAMGSGFTWASAVARWG